MKLSPGKCYIIVGPTGVGKTSVAHCIALAHNCRILSADSMAVYQGMNIGTAKPTLQEQEAVPYHGINLVTPDREFSVATYIEAAGSAMRIAVENGQPLLVAGGTGLYIKALVEGLSESTDANPAIRAEADAMMEQGGITALQEKVKVAAPEHYAALSDPSNPRRLVRAWEKSEAGVDPSDGWKEKPEQSICGLWMKPSLLSRRIEDRVHQMMEAGLQDEVLELRKKYRALSPTAAQAIGYKEIADMLDGAVSSEEALEKTVVRTRRLAKRQRTWFRHQLNVEWISVKPKNSAEEIAERVMAYWIEHGHNELTV